MAYHNFWLEANPIRNGNIAPIESIIEDESTIN